MLDIHYGRKRSGIVRELSTKIKEWLDSISDERVRKLAAENVIVTGGSIASMLLGEKVNDYDCYFRDKETTIAVAQYYVDEFNKANNIKVGSGVVKYNPYVIEDTIKNCKGQLEDRVCIYIKSAGVAAENQDTYQYFESQPEDITQAFVDSLVEQKASGKAKYRPVFLSANAITLSSDIQLIIRFYGDPKTIHDNFDFVHAMSYYSYYDNQLVLPAEALESLLSRTLVYKGSLYPLATTFRMKKFLERGWRIGAGEMLKIMFQISELDLTNHEVLTEQLTGVDQAYLHQLIKALKDVPSEKINSTYVVAIIDKIFN